MDDLPPVEARETLLFRLLFSAFAGASAASKPWEPRCAAGFGGLTRAELEPEPEPIVGYFFPEPVFTLIEGSNHSKADERQWQSDASYRSKSLGMTNAASVHLVLCSEEMVGASEYVRGNVCVQRGLLGKVDKPRHAGRRCRARGR